MEPPSPIQALGVNPFPEETSRADSGKGQSQRRNDIAIALHHTAGNTVLTAKHNHTIVKRDFSDFLPQRVSVFSF